MSMIKQAAVGFGLATIFVIAAAVNIWIFESLSDGRISAWAEALLRSL